MKISAAKLLDLQPGNDLDLKLDPEAHVDLTVNGKHVGKGEVVQIGESLGLRVLQIGK